MTEDTRDSSIMQAAGPQSWTRSSSSSGTDVTGLLSSSMHPEDRHELCSTWSTEAELAPTSSALALAMQALSMRSESERDEQAEITEADSGKGKGKEPAISLNDDEEHHEFLEKLDETESTSSYPVLKPTAIPITSGRAASASHTTSYSRPYSISYSFASGSSSSPRTPASFNFSPLLSDMYAAHHPYDADDDGDRMVTPATSYASSNDKSNSFEEHFEQLDICTRESADIAVFAPVEASPAATSDNANPTITVHQDQYTQLSVPTPVSAGASESACTISTIVDNTTTDNSNNINTSRNALDNTIGDITSRPDGDNTFGSSTGVAELSTSLLHRVSLPLLIPLPPSPDSARPELPQVYNGMQSSRAPSRSPVSRPRSLSAASFAALSISSSTSASSKSSFSKMKSKIANSKLGLKGLLKRKSSRFDSEPVASGSGSAPESIISPLSPIVTPPARPEFPAVDVPPSSPAARKGKWKMRAFSSPLPYVITSSPPLTPALTLGLSPSGTPLPLTDGLDYLDEEVAAELEIPPNRFEEMLPRELQLACIRAIITMCEVEYERENREGRWTVYRAGQERWFGTVKGYREIFKLSRVSHAWRSLAFDGQLWSSLDLSPYSNITRTSAQYLISSASSFIKHASIAGLPRLFPNLARGIAAPYTPQTQLRSLNLRGCRHIATGPLHLLINISPLLEDVNFCASSAVTNYTMNLLASHCPELKVVNVTRCPYLSGSGIIALGSIASGPLINGKPLKHSKVRELRIAGLRYANADVLSSIGQHMPDLEVLDMSGSRLLTDNAIEAFVLCAKDSDFPKVALTSREAGRDPAEMATYYRRLTKLRHLNLSSCPEITDRACFNLAHAVPKLEFLELADLGGAIKDDGLVHLLGTVPCIRKIDLDDAMDITDRVLDALTPSPPEHRAPRSGPEPGDKLEHLVLSYITNLTNEAMLRLIRACTKLVVLEVDNTRVSDSVLREFVRLARRRKTAGAEIVAVDCRSVSKAVVSELAVHTRPRRGWKAWEAQPMGYDDGSPHTDAHAGGPNLTAAQDECDESKIVLKSFWSWQAVDTAAALRERRRRIVGSRRLTEGDLNLSRIVARGGLDPDLVREDQVEGDGEEGPAGTGEGRRRSRWVIRWSGGRGNMGGSMYVGGADPAAAAGGNGDDRGCVIM